MAGPKAYFLTWTTYGAWLHGDARGSVDDDHSAYRTPLAPARERRTARMQARMRHDAVILSPADRTIVEGAIRAHCDHREWWLGAVNARSNHVHCVVAAPGVRPEQVVGQLKSWATRPLREHGGFPKGQRIWTREASTRYLWTDEDVRSAREYVIECQDAPHKERAPDLPGE